MSTIYIGRHTCKDHLFDVLECEMSSTYWDAIGVLLEEVFLLNYPELYDGIARIEEGFKCCNGIGGRACH